MVNLKYDWPSVERYFFQVDEKCSLKDVSLHFNIPYQSVRRYAAQQEWHSKRYRFWIKKVHGF